MSSRWRLAVLMRHAVAILVSLAIAGAFAALVLETRTYFVDVPFWDEWLLPPLIAQWDQGTLRLADLAAPHNEHIPLFPRVVLLALARRTHWNLWYECVANLVLAIVALVPPLLWIRREPRVTGVPRALLYAVVAIVLLSLNQWENWMWGWQVEVFLCAAALTWGIFALTIPGDLRALAAASLCGIVATLSFANGLLFWPLTMPAAWSRWRRRPIFLAGWVAIGAAVAAWYANALHWRFLQPGELPTQTPLAWLFATLRVLGSSLAGDMGHVRATLAGAVGAGGALAVAIATAVRRARGRETSPDVAERRWWTLLSVGLASASMIAFGRMLPQAQPVASRYLTFTNLFWIALAALLVRLDRRLIAAALVIPALTTVTAVQERPMYVSRRASLQSARAALFAPIDNPLVARLFWRQDFVLAQLPTLRRLRLSVYDCARQISKKDWDRAAAVIQRYGRAGDVAVTSSDWGAGCLADRLRDAHAGVRIHSADERQANVATALAGRSSAFVISGGDVTSLEARSWIERHGFPLYRSPIGSLRLLYYPDRVGFLRDRARAEEVAADRPAFERDRDLIAADDDRFFPWGWEHPQTDAGGRYRSIVDRQSFLYVPVVRRPPRVLRIEYRDAPMLAAARGEVTVTIAVNDVPVQTQTIARDCPAWQVDLSSAAWRNGANIVRLSLTGGGGDASRPAFAPLLNVRRVQFDPAGD